MHTRLQGDALIHAFKASRIPPEAFGHKEHVRMAWTYLRRWPFLDALRRFEMDLKCFATAHSKPNLYHTTVTWAYFALIQERMHGREPDEGWEAFATANPDLLRWRDGALCRYYDASILGCETAREIFILPPAREPLKGGALDQ